MIDRGEKVPAENQSLPEIENPLLIPCHVCGRTFKPESLERHVKICEKSVSKQRKVFDSSKQRLACLESVDVPKSTIPLKPVSPIQKKSVEVGKSRADVKNKAAKVFPKSKGKVEATINSRIASVASHYIQCPHCERKFNPKAADRHIEWCQEHKFRESISTQTSSVAKERLEARTKYKAPSPVKRRLSNKWKYSPVSQKQRSPSPTNKSIQGCISKEVVNTLVKNRERASLRISASNAIEIKNRINCKTTAQKTCSLGENKTISKSCSYPSVKSSNSVIGQNLKSLSKRNNFKSDIANSESSYVLDARTEPEGDEDLEEYNYSADNSNRSRKTKSLNVDEYNPFISAEKQMEMLMNSSWPGAKDIKSAAINSSTFSPNQPFITIADPMYGVDPLFSRYLTPSSTCKESSKTKRSHNPHSQLSLQVGQASPQKVSSHRDEYWKQFFSNEHSLRDISSENNLAYLNGNNERYCGGENKNVPKADLHSPEASVAVLNNEGLPSPKCAIQEIFSSATDDYNDNKLSKFCHECGHKYPVTIAKFCCECGVRRLSLD